MTWSERASENWAAVVDASPQWVPLVADFTGSRWRDREHYAAQVAETQFALATDRGVVPKRADIDRLRDVIVTAFDTLESDRAHQNFLYVPADPRLLPLPVFLAVWEVSGDREAALGHYSGADVPGAVEPPIVEEFSTGPLGGGRRVLRYDLAPDGSQALSATLTYAWRSEDYPSDIQLITSTPHLGQLFSALEDIDAFARCIVPTPDPSRSPGFLDR